jgi:hypothetical protein
MVVVDCIFLEEEGCQLKGACICKEVGTNILQ